MRFDDVVELFDAGTLARKLARIEALHAGATTPGERAAAADATRRIKERLAAMGAADPPIEFRIKIDDPWSRRLFLALARRYGLRPFRYPRQHASSVMLKVPQRFVDETLWPEFKEMSRALQEVLAEATERAVSAIHADRSDAEVLPEPGALGPIED